MLLPVGHERKKEPFDYTKWQENLFKGMSIEEISLKAADYRKKKKNIWIEKQ